jgi:hypothetical protein
MVIDVIHPGQDRVRGQHRGGEQALHRDGVGAVGERGQLRPDDPQVRQRAQPGQRPRISGGQDLPGPGPAGEGVQQHRARIPTRPGR